MASMVLLLDYISTILLTELEAEATVSDTSVSSSEKECVEYVIQTLHDNHTINQDNIRI